MNTTSCRINTVSYSECKNSNHKKKLQIQSILKIGNFLATHCLYSLIPYLRTPSFIICDGIFTFLLQNLFQNSEASATQRGAFAKHLSCTHPFKQFALSGTVALLEFIHNLSHALDGLRLVLRGKSEYDACAYDGSASSLHITHTCRKGIASILNGFFFHAGEVVIGAEHSLCAIMRTTSASSQLLCLFLFPYYYLLVVFIGCFDLGYKDNAFIINT